VSTSPAAGTVRELLDRAEDFVRRGDPKAAMSFYQAALKNARGSAFADSRTVQRLRQGQEFIQRRSNEFLKSLNQSLTNVALHDDAARIRLAHSLEMLKGRREIFPQQPSVFYYPYLSQRQFFERTEFDWVPEIEAATPAIREELLTLLDEDVAFRPYVEDEPDRPRRQFAHLNDNRDWSALFIWNDAQLVPDLAERCPRTVEALRKVPLTNIGRRTPCVLFSRLEAGAHIPAHNGMLNCRLICHLPLIVPTGCWLRVGNETREWEEGKLLIFDDSIEHEAKNPTDELRIILLFDIWRPELDHAERRAISSIFDSIDNFQALPDA
jgi:hypothetical protein